MSTSGSEEPSVEEEANNSLRFDLVQLREWIKTQVYLPQDLSDQMLFSFQLFCETDEDMKKLIKEYFHVRLDQFKLFRNRHPASCVNQKAADTKVATTTTPETANRIVFCCWYTDPDLSRPHIYQQMKYIFTEIDLILQTQGLADKEITIILDMEKFKREHLDALTKYSTEIVTRVFLALPIRLGAVLILNAPEYISEYTCLFEPFDFHLLNSPLELSGFIPLELVPSDMGGLANSPTREEFRDSFMQRLWHLGPKLAFEELLWERLCAIKLANTPNPPRKGGDKKEKKEKKEKKAKKGKGKKGKKK